MNKYVYCFLFVVIFLNGCASYPHKVFKQNTGMEFGKEVNLCPGGAVKSSKTCMPTGSNWKKGKEIIVAQLEIGDKIFQNIDNNFLLQRITDTRRMPVHKYDLWSSELNSPRSGIELVEPAEKLFGTDFIPETYVKVEIAEIYQKQAIKEAVATIEAEAKAKNIQLSGEFIASVKSHLKQEIKKTKNTELTYYYITTQYIGKLSEGETDPNFVNVEKMQPAIKEFKSGNSLITGISGFIFSNFKSNQTVFEDTMLKTAIDSSISFASEQQLKQIEEIKMIASLKWSNEINEQINTDIQTAGTGIHFIPLWYKSISLR